VALAKAWEGHGRKRKPQRSSRWEQASQVAVWWVPWWDSGCVGDAERSGGAGPTSQAKLPHCR